MLKLEKIVGKMRGVEFRRMRSLYFASRPRDGKRVRDEGQLRQRHGFDLEILEASAVRKQFGIDAPVALLTSVAAETDPYQLAHALLSRCIDAVDRFMAAASWLRSNPSAELCTPVPPMASASDAST